MKILSLDLEGVLVMDANIFINPDGFGEQETPELIKPRNYYRAFLSGCEKQFDEIYMNTCVDEATNQIVMKKLGFPDFQYLQREILSEQKIINLKDFAKCNLVVHVEDGMPDRDMDLAHEFGIHYLEILPYTFHMSEDKELLRVLEEMDNL